MSCATECHTCASLQTALLQLIGEPRATEDLAARLLARTGLSPADFRGHYPNVSACLADIYEGVVGQIHDDFVDAFAESGTWPGGVSLGMERTLTRMARRPGEARLVFVEVLRGGRELLRRREAARRRMIRLFDAEYRRHELGDQPSEVQHEMLIGAAFQRISAEVAAGRIDELPALEPEFIGLIDLFEPIAA